MKEYGGDSGITSGPLYKYRPKCRYKVDFGHPALRIPRTESVLQNNLGWTRLVLEKSANLEALDWKTYQVNMEDRDTAGQHVSTVF